MPSEGDGSMFGCRIQKMVKIHTCAGVRTAVQTISAGGEKKMPIRILLSLLTARKRGILAWLVRLFLLETQFEFDFKLLITEVDRMCATFVRLGFSHKKKTIRKVTFAWIGLDWIGLL